MSSASAYRVVLSRQARRALTVDLPEAVAAACWELITTVLTTSPHRAGKPLRGRLTGRHSARRGEFRVVYRIFDDRVLVEVIAITHRRDAYRA